MKARTTKRFDCVELKNTIQAKILAEYESQKDAYPSFEAFVLAQVRGSAWARRMSARFARRKRTLTA